MKRLIVTADDVGLHRGMTLGAVEAHEKGIVTACSVVANGAELDHAVELLGGRRSLDVGAHLCFVEERPLRPAERVRSLVGGDGRFHPHFKSFFVRYQLGRIDFAELRDELRLQIETLVARGFEIVHFNGHQHLHLLPRVFDVVEKLAEEFGVRWVRIPRERSRGGMVRQASIRVLNAYAAAARQGATTLHADRTIGISEAGHLDAAKILELIEEIEGVTELVVHPGRGDRELSSAYGWQYAWDGETDALCSSVVREKLAVSGVTLTRISTLVATG